MALGLVDGTLGHPRFLTGIAIVVVIIFCFSQWALNFRDKFWGGGKQPG